MNYNKLKYFHVVATTGNITKAAEQCFICQSGMTKHIMDLEKELGAQLFTRSNRDVQLTDAGRVLHQQTAAFFNSEAEIVRKVHIASGKQERLNIAVMGTKVVDQIPTLLETFGQQYPSIAIDVWRLNWDPSREALRSAKMDAGFLVTVPEETDFKDDFDCVPLISAPSTLIVSSKHPLAKEKSICLKQARNEPFLFPAKDENTFSHANMMRTCKMAGFEPNIVAMYPSTETLISMVQLNRGVVILSRLAPVFDRDDVVLVPLEDQPPSSLVFAWCKGNSNPAIQALARQAQQFDWKV